MAIVFVLKPRPAEKRIKIVTDPHNSSPSSAAAVMKLNVSRIAAA